MKRLIVPLMVFAAVGLVLSVIGLVVVSRRMGEGRPGRVLEPDAVAVGLSIPEFRLVDQEGAARTQEILEGRVTVVDFIFTHCPFACPTMTLEMGDVARDLAGTGVRFLSISVDPGRDTPARLKEYGTDAGVDFARWTFLTGDYPTIEGIVLGSLQFALQPDPNRKITLPDGSTMENITHPTKLILVGPDRRVLGFFDPNRVADMEMLRVRAKAAAGVVGK